MRSTEKIPGLRACVLILLGVGLVTQPPVVVHAQGTGPFERPVEDQPELPEFEEPGEAPELVLPPLPEPAPEDRRRLSRLPRLTVREFRVTGSTVFSAEELEAITRPFVGRPISAEDLQRLRNELTLFYVDHGYVNSGAVLPDQDATDGIVELEIVEGHLTRIDLSGNTQFRDRYLRDRLELGAARPLNVRHLERQLQILQQDRRIRTVHARLGPGLEPGEGSLHLDVEEESPYLAWLELNNHQSPSIGAYRAALHLQHENLTGNGDVLWMNAAGTEGLEDYEASYEIPINARDTTFGVRYSYSTSDVVEEPFDDIDIRSCSWTVGLGLRHPLFRSLRNSLELSLEAELRESRTFLLDRGFSFTPGPEDGRSEVTVVRLGQDWLYRDRHQVLAARSTLSVGLDALGATIRGGSVPDGQFLSWLAQLQWARRFDPWSLQLLFRTDLQLSTSALLSLEQFQVGGHASVRGYRENEFVRDNGFSSSLELRIPLWSDAAGRPVLQLAPFADIGRSWNTNRGESQPRTIYSVGVGLRWRVTRHVEGQLYVAEALRHVRSPADRDLQDSGVHFGLRIRM